MDITICDHCGRKIKESFRDYHGDLDSKTLAVIEVRPRLLNKTTEVVNDPDLCRECIIKTLS